ncbi:MAG: hypothetical protein ACE5KI_02490 [Dehalococcoidia bacterium]
MPKIPSVVERAYHGTLEEQDDTNLWMTAAVRGAGGDMTVLLRGNAVNYAVEGQDASGLNIGGIPLSVPPKIDEDVADLIGKGVSVYAVLEDLQARAISEGDMVGGVQVIPQAKVAELWDQHDSIWHW